MKSYKLIPAITLFAVLLLACATTAYADDSGAVYGQATMQPTVSISVSGQGASASEPLYYEGHKGETVGEFVSRELTVANDGDCIVDLYLSFGSDPDDGYGDTWTLAGGNGSGFCAWYFGGAEGWVTVPRTGDAYLGRLDIGGHQDLPSMFAFPTNFVNGNPHNMTALITGSEY